MTKKFTEEQYQKIVELHDKRDFSVDGTLDVITYFVHNISRTGDLDIDTALAISNPLTREWAHDKFVEKEKRYVWKLNGLYLVKAIDDDGSIFFGSHDASMALSTSQIMEWGFNPEMFDREEVQ